VATSEALDAGTAAVDLRWRAAVLAVDRAQRRYLALLEAERADERALELAWLALWRAEQRRDSIVYLSN
jgi:hypothetical protein